MPNKQSGIFCLNSRQFIVSQRSEDVVRPNISRQAAISVKRSEFDVATQLYSQGYFERRFAQELRRAERYCEFLSLVLIDISSALAAQSPGEKAQAIKKVGNIIGDTVRSTDILATLGKNRLALILTETPKEGAFRLAERLSEKIISTSIPQYMGMLKREDVNIGIASFPEDGSQREDLLQVASSPLNTGSSVLGSGNVD